MESQVISPATFIPIAEKNGSIVTIGKWVVEESVRQYAAWRKQFGFPFVMSINISAIQYKKEDFVESIVETLNKYKVKPSEIELEITETILIDDFEAVFEKLKVLRDQDFPRRLRNRFFVAFLSEKAADRYPED